MRNQPTLPRLLRDAVAADPAQPAVTIGNTSLSYGELERTSNQVANCLLDRGVQRGDRVGIQAAKSLEVVATIYGIMKTGAAYVPINPEAPTAYIESVISDCAIHLVFADDRRASHLFGMVGKSELQMVLGPSGFDGPESVSWDKVFDNDDNPSPLPGLDGDDLAYMLYTSGTTGRPKGIMHNQRSATAFAHAVATTYQLSAADRLTSHAPLHFDLSTFDFFGAAEAHAETVIVPEAFTRFPASLSQLLQAKRITVMYAVPFAFVQLLLRGALEERDLSSLRWVVFAGEVFPTKHLRELMQRLPDARFSNVYGPTETNGVTYYHVPSLSHDDDSPIPIGRPFDGMIPLVVDEEGIEVGGGEAGELLFATDTRMTGYWGQPQWTADVTAIREVAGRRVTFHRTGDLVRFSEAGELELIGRMDRQIKSRGYRVELDEIEAVLAGHISVEEAVVYTVPDSDGSNEIRAVVRPANNTRDGAELFDSLRSHLGSVLPRYAVPVVIESVKTVPRTSTGKIDRAGLIESLAPQVDSA